MREISVVITCLLSVITNVYYLQLIIRNRVQPVLASWVILAVTTSLSFWTYWNSPQPTLQANIGNTLSFLSCNTILVTLLVLQWRQGWPRMKFNHFQERCLATSAFIIIFWWGARYLFGGQNAATISNILTQILMFMGYWVLAERLWRSEKNTESLTMWSGAFAASVVSVIPAILEHDKLAMLFGARALVTSGVIIALILRLQRIEKRLITQGASA